MKTIIAREVPSSDFAVKYAIKNENDDTYTHHSISFGALLARGVSAQEILKESLAKQYQDDIDLIVLPMKSTKASPIIKISESIVNDRLTIKAQKDLNRVRSKSTIFQYLEFSLRGRLDQPITDSTKLGGKLIGSLYKLESLLLKPFRRVSEFLGNLLWSRYQDDLWEGKTVKLPSYLMPIELLRIFIGRISEINLLPFDGLRIITGTESLAVSVREEDLSAAIQGILTDINTLSSKGALLGHMIYPSILAADNTSGNDKNVYLVFAQLVFKKNHKLLKNGNVGYFENPLDENPTKEIYIKYGASEGRVSRTFRPDEEFPYAALISETVKIKDGSGDVVATVEDGEDVENLKALVAKERKNK